MTKEELKKEAEEKFLQHRPIDFQGFTYYKHYLLGYEESAEPREKRIIELEALIEKMKRCAICKYSTDLGYCKIRCNGGECDNYSSWEIKEDVL